MWEVTWEHWCREIHSGDGIDGETLSARNSSILNNFVNYSVLIDTI